MMTFAQFKRDAASGIIALEMVERFGKVGEEIPSRLHGIRTFSKVGAKVMALRNQNGEDSRLEITSANLFEYDGETVCIYNAGERPLTEEERKVWEHSIEVQNKAYEENPYSSSCGYYQRKDYVAGSSCPWMIGGETIRGKRFDYRDTVRDNAVRGKLILKYKVHHIA